MDVNQEQIIEIIDKPVQKNGFAWPPSIYQLLLYFLDLLFSVEFYMFSIVSINSNLGFMWVMISIYSIFFCICLFAIIMGTAIDPSDPTIALKKEYTQKNLIFPIQNYNFECKVCQSQVEDRTKHCGLCNRCVNLFDHHCGWLNNCVGKANYCYFILLIAFGFLQCMINSGMNSYLIYSFIRADGLSNLFIVYGENIRVVAWILNCLVLVCALSSGIYFGYLIVLHIWLIKHGLTTYEYILKLRSESQKIMNPDLEEVPHKSNIIIKSKRPQKKKKSKTNYEINKNKNVSIKVVGDSTDDKKEPNFSYYDKQVTENPVRLNINKDDSSSEEVNKEKGHSITKKIILCATPSSKVKDPEPFSSSERQRSNEMNSENQEVLPEKLDEDNSKITHSPLHQKLEDIKEEHFTNYNEQEENSIRNENQIEPIGHFIPESNLNYTNSFNKTEKIHVDTRQNIQNQKVIFSNLTVQVSSSYILKRNQNLPTGGTKEETRRQMSLQDKFNYN